MSNDEVSQCSEENITHSIEESDALDDDKDSHTALITALLGSRDLNEDFDVKSFVFYRIAELNRKRFVKCGKKYMRTLAECKGVGLDVDTLVEIEMDYYCRRRSEIRVDFGCVSKLPKVGSVIEAFGYLEFVRRDRKKVPVFTVWFWNERHGNLPSYVRMMLSVRKRWKLK